VDICVICGSNLFGKSKEEYPPITQINADLKAKKAYIGGAALQSLPQTSGALSFHL
jgi:hypothetical protein